MHSGEKGRKKGRGRKRRGEGKLEKVQEKKDEGSENIKGG